MSRKDNESSGKKSLNLYFGLTMQAATFLMFGARPRWQSKSRRSYNPRQKSLKQTQLLLNFLEKSWDLLLKEFVLTVMCPLPPQCWVTRILKHWDCCNAQMNWGRENAHKCFKIFDEDCRFSLSISLFRSAIKIPLLSLLVGLHNTIQYNTIQ